MGVVSRSDAVDGSSASSLSWFSSWWLFLSSGLSTARTGHFQADNTRRLHAPAVGVPSRRSVLMSE
jgi:hypothetical protein